MPEVALFTQSSEFSDCFTRCFPVSGCGTKPGHFSLDPGIDLVIDVRDSAIDPRVGQAINTVIETGSRHRIICVHDGVIPIGLVEPLTLLEATYVDASELTEDRVRKLFSARAPRVAFPEHRTFESGDHSISSYDRRLFDVLEQVRRIARHDVTLLIVGETGTGKSTLARIVHECSPRREHPFQTVACGALPPEIIESELFGHVRGAFTGAERRRAGRFSAAGQGTLLLDEIDVLGNKQQAMLLRVIETGEYEEVGSTETRHSEARVVVASNVDLESLTTAKKFREDLYYRLNVLEVRLPPLRERRVDIVPLAMQFVRQTCRERGLSIETVEVRFLERILEYPWPGNLRELKNHVQRAVLFADDGLLSIDALSPRVAHWDAADEPEEDTLAAKVASTERALLEDALQKHDYKRTATAKSLGISRVGLYKKMKRLGMLEASNAR